MAILPLRPFVMNQNLVWDVATLAWVKMEQPVLEADAVTVTIVNPLPVSGPLTDTQLRAADVKITLDGESVPVTGTFFQATQPVSIAGTVQVDVTDEPTRDLGKVDVASLDQYTPVSGRLPVDGSGVTQPVSIAAAVNPSTGFGKTLTYVAVNQGVAGTTVLAAADASNKHKLMGAILTLSAAGTLKFTDGVADVVGPMDIAANGGFVLNTSIMPWTQTGAVNRALNLITTSGAARGVVIILTEP